MLMKQRLISASLLLCLGFVPLVMGCSIMYSPGDTVQRRPHLQISRGMSMAEVRQMLGEPSYRRFNTHQEEWEYVRQYSRPNRIVVTFEGGLVASLNTYDVAPPPSEHPIVIEPEVQRPPRPLYPPYGPPGYGWVDNAWFEEFFRRVQEKSFTSDKLKLIASAPDSKLFSSRQCLRLMDLFTWGDEKLKVLRALAPRLADHEYVYKIVDSFTFDSEKDKAARILGIGRTD